MNSIISVWLFYGSNYIFVTEDTWVQEGYRKMLTIITVLVVSINISMSRCLVRTTFINMGRARYFYMSCYSFLLNFLLCHACNYTQITITYQIQHHLIFNLRTDLSLSSIWEPASKQLLVVCFCVSRSHHLMVVANTTPEMHWIIHLICCRTCISAQVQTLKGYSAHWHQYSSVSLECRLVKYIPVWFQPLTGNSSSHTLLVQTWYDMRCCQRIEIASFLTHFGKYVDLVYT